MSQLQLPQQALIERVRERCDEDIRLTAALMYGSFARGGADRYSDIEFWLFFGDDAFDTVLPEAWVASVGAVYATVVAESGAHVALFRPSLLRGEFHFATASSLDEVRSWTALGVTATNLDKMVVLDRHGALRSVLTELVDVCPVPATADGVRTLCGRFIDWHVFALGVLARGEVARAHGLLGILLGYLTWMARLHHGALGHWATPSKAFERDLPQSAQERYRSCTATADQRQLTAAYQHAWDWGQELLAQLAEQHAFAFPADLLDAVTERTASLSASSRQSNMPLRSALESRSG